MRGLRSLSFVSSLFAFALIAIAKPAHADQTLIADETFTHLAAEGSHHHAKPVATIPTDLAAPVDYRKGSVHIRVDLTKMASTKGLHWLLTLEQPSGYVCVGPQKAMLAPGLYEWDVPLSTLQCVDSANPYDLSKPPKSVSFIIRDTKGIKIDPGNAYDGAPDLTLYFPLTSHVTVTLVSNGATYIPPASTPDAGPTLDAGSDASIVAPSDGGVIPVGDSGTGSSQPPTDAGEPVSLPGDSQDNGCAMSTPGNAGSGAIAMIMAMLGLAFMRRSRR